MKTLKFYLLALFALPVLVASCDKNKNDEDDDVVASCKPVKAYIYYQGQVDDSVAYIYTGDQITKIDAPGSGYMMLEYTNNKVTKRTVYDYSTPGVPDSYEVITYNPDGTLQKVDFFNGGPGGAKWRTTTVSYTAGKYSKLTVTEDTGTGTFVTVLEYLYTYTGNNITGVTVNDFTTTPADTYSYTYVYDANPNYFTKQNPQFMFVDPFFGTFDGEVLPLMVSTNNVTSITEMGVPFVQFTYTLDQKGNLSRMNIGNQPFVGYGYQCP